MPGNPQMRTFSQTTLTIRTDGQKSPNDCSNPPPTRVNNILNTQGCTSIIVVHPWVHSSWRKDFLEVTVPGGRSSLRSHVVPGVQELLFWVQSHELSNNIIKVNAQDRFTQLYYYWYPWLVSTYFLYDDWHNNNYLNDVRYTVQNSYPHIGIASWENSRVQDPIAML